MIATENPILPEPHSVKKQIPAINLPKNQILRVAWLLLIVTPLAISAPAALGAPAVPFKGQGNGHDLAVVPQADGIHISAVVAGNATHLGHFSEKLDYVLAYDFVHFSGTATFTAANGDEIFATFYGSIPGFSSGIFPTPYSSTFTITGGTGRFQNASGGGVITGQDFGNGLFNAAWIGTLNR